MRFSLAAGVLIAMSVAAAQIPHLDVPYVPSPNPVVDGMLKLAGVSAGDTVYDLGCGDGRIVIAAAKAYGARGVGVDINPERVEEARANAKSAKVDDKVRFEENDLFKANIANATVVTLYLLPDVNLRLKAKLMKELKPGTRIVSHSFDMGDWKPEKEQTVEGRQIYLWTVPKK
jgi:SAM-dependent methyltransferase